MPRHIFDTEERFKEWCEEFVKTGFYCVYVTNDNEIILEPRRSTRPSRFGYYKTQKAEEIGQKIAKQYSIPYFKVERYEWDTERPVGVERKEK